MIKAICGKLTDNIILNCERLRVDCGSDHELFIAKFRLKLKNAIVQ